jgi:hypothetical protein
MYTGASQEYPLYMNVSRLSRIVAAVSIMVLASVGSVVSAQASAPCAIAVGPLTTQQEQAVNEYEIQVARANSKHTAVPAMPDAVFVLIGCTSPANQTSTAAANMGATSTSPASTPAAPTPTPTPSTGTTQSSSTFTCPPNGLNKAQLSAINSYEVLLARANSHHTALPDLPSDVAAFLSCQ